MSGAPPPFPLVLSAPSGAGKTTLANALRRRNRDVAFSVSATTRPPRPREVDGESYHFVSRDEFLRMRDAGELIEWAEVHGNLYGTPLANVRRAQARGEHLLLDIDVQGARQIRERVPEAVLVFVLPPSAAALVGRLGFLVQEMHREANTIGSKANHALIAHRVVAIKDEVERLREQVENVE